MDDLSLLADQVQKVNQDLQDIMAFQVFLVQKEIQAYMVDLVIKVSQEWME
jgi:hypothetical protein